MSFKVWLKTNAADKALAPLRHELIALMNAGDSVLDIGCGTGDLLFKAADKICTGLGVDLDRQMIHYASDQCKKNNADHLSFQCADATQLSALDYDVATATLCLHELDRSTACQVLAFMAVCSKRVLIADYAQPITLLARVGIELDEMVSGHYQKFRQYRKAGYLNAYLDECGLSVNKVLKSSIDGILIWDINGLKAA